MIVEGHAPGAAEDFLIWVDPPKCEHGEGCCFACFESAMVPILDAYLDEHPECRPGSGESK